MDGLIAKLFAIDAIKCDQCLPNGSLGSNARLGPSLLHITNQRLIKTFLLVSSLSFHFTLTLLLTQEWKYCIAICSDIDLRIRCIRFAINILVESSITKIIGFFWRSLSILQYLSIHLTLASDANGIVINVFVT